MTRTHLFDMLHLFLFLYVRGYLLFFNVTYVISLNPSIIPNMDNHYKMIPVTGIMENPF